MKVVIVVEEFHPERWYLEHYLARELARLGHEADVVTFNLDNASTNDNDDFEFRVHRLPCISLFKPYHIPNMKAIKYIADFLRREEPDIIHCQPLFSPLSLVFLAYRAIGNHEIVGSLITGSYSINSIISMLKYSIAKIVTEHYVIGQTSMVFAKSEAMKRLLLRLFDLAPDKVRVVPLGADSDVFCRNSRTRYETRTQLGINLDDVVVIVSGKLSPSKRIDELLKAIAPVMRENNKVKLLILGGGTSSYLDTLKAICLDSGISENVLFHPWANRLELPNFFNASDIAVWPSGASISIVEAASVGLPLISMKSPIEAYALSNDNAFLFAPGNIEDLRRLLRLLIFDRKLREEMGLKSRELVENKLNWKLIVQEYLSLYKQARE